MPNSVMIRRRDLVDALRPFKRLSAKSHKEDAVLFMDGSDLVISVVGVASGIEVDGSWSADVRVPATFIIANAKKLPSADPMPVRVSDGRLYFDSLSMGCHVQESGESEILVPADADLLTVLNLGFKYSTEQIQRAGLSKTYAIAQSKLQKLVARSAEPLSLLEITEAEVTQFVNSKLQGRGRN